MPPIGFSFADVRDVDLHYWDADGPDAVGDGDGGMGVCPWVHNHTVVLMVRLLKLVDQGAFMVRLIVIQLNFWELVFQGLEIGLKRDMAVNLRLAAA